MRGKPQAQPDFLTVINLNQCVPTDHPLRAIKQRVDAVLQKLSPLTKFGMFVLTNRGETGLLSDMLFSTSITFNGGAAEDSGQRSGHPAAKNHKGCNIGR